MLDKRRGGSFIGHGGEREIKRKNENNEETERGVIEKRERASTLFQAPTSVFSLSCLRSLRVLAFPSSFYPFLLSSPIQERARRFSATWMERFANGLSSGQTVECHRKKRKARVGGKVCEVTRALETGTKWLLREDHREYRARHLPKSPTRDIKIKKWTNYFCTTLWK